MEWYIAESTEMPLEQDLTSSKIYNYVRRNITTKIVESVTMYVYEECKVLKEDWGLFMQIMAITPYEETKTAYYGEKEKVFYGVPQGNITVFWDNYNGDYSVQRIEDRVTVSFDTLTDNATLSIMIQ